MVSTPKILNRHDLASHLDGLRSEILKEWEIRSRQKVEAARKQTRFALIDSLPEFIDQLVETLKCDDPKLQSKSNSEVACEHAEDRAHQPEYTLDQVIAEYHILRSVITEFIDSAGAVTPECRRITHDFIDLGVNKAAIKYLDFEGKKQRIQTDEIEATKIEAERASQAKSSFLANMSHEIRSPLGAIMGFSGLLKDSDLAADERSNYISIIDRNSSHLLRIIDDILDLTKVEAGKMMIENIEFSFLEFMADFSSLAAIKARENGIIFEFKTETTIPELITSDPTRIRQILTNIVGNAIKFTEKGRVELTIKFEKGQLEFKVSDTGRGISNEQRTHLFQAFAQADSSTTRKFGGTGLGLVLTKKLSQALGGNFTLVESELGKGSVFKVNIPVKTLPQVKMLPLETISQTHPKILTSEQNEINLKGQEILLVEDSPDNQFLIQKMLSKTGAKITLASNGAEGAEMAVAHRFDVILMDIQMPVMDGHEAVRLLRSKDYSGPIVALTAHAMKEERERAVNSGFSHFLTKPINRNSLTDLLSLLHKPINLKN